MEKNKKTILIVAAIIVIAAIASTIAVSKKLKKQLSDKKGKEEDTKQDDNKSELKTNEPKTKETNEQQENNNPKKNINYKDLPDKNPPFKLGDKAKLIYSVQVMLNKKYNAGLETDGIMGEKTVEALCKHVWKTCFSKYQARNYELTLEEIQKILR